MRLVEEPQLWAASRCNRERGTAPLSGGKSLDGYVVKPTVDFHTFSSSSFLVFANSSGFGPKPKVFGHGEVVVKHGRMADIANSRANRAPIAEQVGTEDGGRSTLGSQKTGTEPQKC